MPADIDVEVIMIAQHNADSPLEDHAILLVERILSRLRFPAVRIKVDVHFDYTLREFADHKLALDDGADTQLSGVVELRLNGLFLHQNPFEFYQECIPHELAHIFRALEATKQGVPLTSPHDIEWQRWLHKINSDASVSTAGPDVFDSRAIRWYSGGVPCVCACSGESALEVFSYTRKSLSKLKENEVKCKECEEPYELVSSDAIPEKVIKEVDFIRERLCTKSQHSPLASRD